MPVNINVCIKTDFCSLSVSLSLLRYACSFLGRNFYDTVIVAPSLTFLNILKSSCLALFSWKESLKKSVINLSHISTIGALKNIIRADSGSYSAELQLLFCFLAIFGNWSCDQHSYIPLNKP